MSLSKQIQKSYDDQWSMRFKTRHPDKDAYNGIVLAKTKKFIAIKKVVDFEFDGIIVLPKNSLKGCRDNKYDKCGNEILRENGVIEKLEIPAWLPECVSIKNVIIQLMTLDVWPGIEMWMGNKKDTAFYLGPVTQIKKDNFWLYCYDAAGKWEKEYKLAFSDIFRIEFDSKYCNNFNEYMRRRPFKD